MRATNPRKAMKCGIRHTRVLVAVYSFLFMALTDKLHTLILLDYEISFKKCTEVPGFVITLKIDNDITECILPYDHFNEEAIKRYITQMYNKLSK